MSSYVVIYGGAPERSIALVVVDGIRYACVSNDDWWIRVIRQVAVSHADQDLVDDQLLATLVGDLPYYRVGDQLPLDGTLGQATDILERIYFS